MLGGPLTIQPAIKSVKSALTSLTPIHTSFAHCRTTIIKLRMSMLHVFNSYVLKTKITFISMWCVGRIWWKLQSHNFVLKMYFLACAYLVVLITDQFWIKWFFGKMSFSGQKRHFLGKNGFLTLWAARGSKVVLELFVWRLISYLFMKKNLPALSGKK